MLTVGNSTYPAGTIVISAHPLFATLNAVYTEFTSLLGFNVTSTGIYHTLENIIANYLPGGYAEAVGIFLLFTSSLTVTDGTSSPTPATTCPSSAS